MRLSKPILIVVLTTLVGLPAIVAGQDLATPGTEHTPQRYPAEDWLQYVDVSDAGFSSAALANAKRFWEKRDSSAFLAVSGGAVVASWGEVDRRFLCHSVRKSLLSALYGVFREEIDLDQTLAELGIDDEPPLTNQEKQARVVDLICSRSGVYHEAAAEPDAMSNNRPARGSHKPGSHWWYNNWDFNTALVVFEQETGQRIFAAFDKTIAKPIGMQDYRVSDGYYHYEREKSLHPAYPFRMSTRDLARFGLLYARGGRWQDKQVIPAEWVRESTQPHSDVDMGAKYGNGYGYMWWIEGTQGYTARGTGGHILAVYPDQDLVMVIRADTYHGKSISTRACMRLFDMVAKAGQGARAARPRLRQLPTSDSITLPTHALSARELAAYEYKVKLESGRQVTVTAMNDVLMIDYGFGTYRLWPESNTRFMAEDCRDPVLFEFGKDGRVSQVWVEQLCYLEATAAAKQGDLTRTLTWVKQAVNKFPESSEAHFNLAQVLHSTGKSAEALQQLHKALEIDPGNNNARSLLFSLQLRRYGWIIGVVVVIIVVFVTKRLLRRRKIATDAVTGATAL